MNVKTLIELLIACSPEAEVFVMQSEHIGDYTWADMEHSVTGILPWPEPAETTERVELVIDRRLLDEE